MRAYVQVHRQTLEGLAAMAACFTPLMAYAALPFLSRD